VTVKSLGNLAVDVAGTLSMTSGGDMSFIAPNITLSATEVEDIDSGTLTTLSNNTIINGTTNVALHALRVDFNPNGFVVGEVALLPLVEFTETELEEIFPVIIEEDDIDINFPTPKFSVVKPDGSTSYSKQTFGYKETGSSGVSAFTGNSLSIIESGGGNIDVENKVVLSGDGSVVYVNQYATRDKALTPELEDIIVSAATKTKLDVQIFSGGMTPSKRTGSDRHLGGFGCDVWLYADGKKLGVNDSLFQDFAKSCKEAGATSMGAGNGYMGGIGLHVDIAKGNTVRDNAASYWGAGGRSRTAPTWLVNIMKA
jgi:hypothetical protein